MATLRIIKEPPITAPAWVLKDLLDLELTIVDDMASIMKRLGAEAHEIANSAFYTVSFEEVTSKLREKGRTDAALWWEGHKTARRFGKLFIAAECCLVSDT